MGPTSKMNPNFHRNRLEIERQKFGKNAELFLKMKEVVGAM